MNRPLASIATLATLATAAVLVPTQAAASVVRPPCGSIARINQRTIGEPKITMYACYNLPGANGRTGYFAELVGGWGGAQVSIRYRGVAGPISTSIVPSDGAANTPAYWGKDNYELQACAYLYDELYCAWTFNDNV